MWSPTGFPTRSLAAGFAHDERNAGRSVAQKVRAPWPIRAWAALGFHPVGSRWGVNAASASGATDGLAGFCEQVAELQRAMGASGASLQTVAALDEVRHAAICAASERTWRARLPTPDPSGPTSSAAGRAA